MSRYNLSAYGKRTFIAQYQKASQSCRVLPAWDCEKPTAAMAKNLRKTLRRLRDLLSQNKARAKDAGSSKLAHPWSDKIELWKTTSPTSQQVFQ